MFHGAPVSDPAWFRCRNTAERKPHPPFGNDFSVLIKPLSDFINPPSTFRKPFSEFVGRLSVFIRAISEVSKRRSTSDEHLSKFVQDYAARRRRPSRFSRHIWTFIIEDPEFGLPPPATWRERDFGSHHRT